MIFLLYSCGIITNKKTSLLYRNLVLFWFVLVIKIYRHYNVIIGRTTKAMILDFFFIFMLLYFIIMSNVVKSMKSVCLFIVFVSFRWFVLIFFKAAIKDWVYACVCIYFPHIPHKNKLHIATLKRQQ